MYRSANFGLIGVNPGNGLEAAISLAKEYGFKGIEASPGQVIETGTEKTKELLKNAGIVISGFGLPQHPMQGTDEEYEKALEKLPGLAKAMADVGVDRCCTYLGNSSNILAYDENFALHVKRISPAAKILNEYGIRLGLEFIGPKSIRTKNRYEFIYTAEKMLELAYACGKNCGLLLDAWHWYMGADNRELFENIPDQKYIVNVHVNDSPKGNRDELPDSPRALPGETGIIDIAYFMNGLKSIGYDGPVVVEPFSSVLSGMGNNDEKMTMVRKSLDKIWVD